LDNKDSGIEAQGGKLIVKKDLGFGQYLNLEGILKTVIGTDSNIVYIDLNDVRHLCSSNLAVLASACNTLIHRGKAVHLIAQPAVAKILRLGGIERLAKVEEAK